MTVLIKLFYAAAVTVLLILSLAFGVRTFYSGPESPEYPQSPIPWPKDQDDPAILEYELAQRQYQEEYARYEEKRAVYRRNVFFVATLCALAGIAGGVSLRPQLDALRLGLVGGGLGMLIYAVTQAGGDLGEIGSTALFVVALAALALIIAAGYRWLSTVEGERG